MKVCFHFHDHETRFQKQTTFTLTVGHIRAIEFSVFGFTISL
jgi:hypothetical protein